MADWFDKAAEDLDELHRAGQITDAEYSEQMRNLRAEFNDAANEAAEDARTEYLGNW